jgi:hypothetical protein
MVRITWANFPTVAEGRISVLFPLVGQYLISLYFRFTRWNDTGKIWSESEFGNAYSIYSLPPSISGGRLFHPQHVAQKY